jgi:hypothetical protein
MLTAVNPKLPMRNKDATRNFYITKLGFKEFGSADFDGYLMLEKDEIQIHFFEFKEIDPLKNYGQIYIRTTEIEKWYQTLLERNVKIHPEGNLTIKPWRQYEFSILDPDTNLITFGQAI